MGALRARVTQRIDTTNNWSAVSNSVPLQGEIIVYSDSGKQPKIKIGDGSTTISDLPFNTIENIQTSDDTVTINAPYITLNDPAGGSSIIFSPERSSIAITSTVLTFNDGNIITTKNFATAADINALFSTSS